MPNEFLRSMTRGVEPLSGGHRLCVGCAASVIIRQVVLASEHPVVIANATGCVEVCTSVYPYTSWKVPWIHSAFENTAASISGVEAAYRARKLRGEIPADKTIKFLAIGGDGGTYDIGLQALSGAMERGHDFVYVCYDNGAYMNTGIQRSSSTPFGANTTTSPAGSVIPGKQQERKDLTAIAAAHGIPYVAQSSPGYPMDLSRKARKAFNTPGPAFINVHSPCPLGWKTEAADSMILARLAVDTCFWPVFEIDHGHFRLTMKPREKKPVADYLKLQGRFKHLFKKGNAHLIDQIQATVDEQWEALLQREALSLREI